MSTASPDMAWPVRLPMGGAGMIILVTTCWCPNCQSARGWAAWASWPCLGHLQDKFRLMYSILLHSSIIHAEAAEWRQGHLPRRPSAI